MTLPLSKPQTRNCFRIRCVQHRRWCAHWSWFDQYIGVRMGPHYAADILLCESVPDSADSAVITSKSHGQCMLQESIVGVTNRSHIVVLSRGGHSSVASMSETSIWLTVHLAYSQTTDCQPGYPKSSSDANFYSGIEHSNYLQSLILFKSGHFFREKFTT